jgi:predicted phage-related endonuclease
MVQQELVSTIRSLKELKAFRDEIDTEIEEKENALKAEMEKHGVEEMKIDIFKVMWKKIISNRFDSSAFRKAHEDIYNMFTKPVESRRFTIA